jgi:hypothetical protein
MAADARDLLPDVERERLRSLVTANLTTADVLHADDYELVTPTGTVLTKSQYLTSIGAGQLRYLTFEPVSPIAVRVVPGAAVLRYQAHIVIAEGEHTADFVCWHTDYYELRAQQWQAVWSQATKIP